jgi:hypothetical protein
VHCSPLPCAALPLLVDQALGVSVLSFVAFFAVLGRCLTSDAPSSSSSSSSGGGSDGAEIGAAGLGLSYALPIIGALQGLISSFTETEKEMISMERMQTYAEVPPEDTGGTV